MLQAFKTRSKNKTFQMRVRPSHTSERLAFPAVESAELAETIVRSVLFPSLLHPVLPSQ